MPFYRITIWLEGKKLVQGIREHTNANIDFVTNFYRQKAYQAYGHNKVKDVEAAMLSNHATAVRKYLEEKEKKRLNKKQWPMGDQPSQPTPSRKHKPGPDTPLGERTK